MFRILHSKKGFTLVELIVVVIIVGILAAVAIPMMQGNVMRARRSEAVAALGTIRTAERLFASENAGAFTAQTAAQFIAGNGPLSVYIRPGDLDGTFYSEECYAVALGGAGGYTITATPAASTAVRAADVLTAGVTTMTGDGVIANP